ncbi:MAG: DUF2490 domain-containing protein [Verrucomicrobiales bacterium]|nr:DUF2490 domain-containing protein [Verrucomicrobiales bacterium]MCP5558836.1 DUF2490 domain-containing protein [Verrucomicrobiaceae bacterium]
MNRFRIGWVAILLALPTAIRADEWWAWTTLDLWKDPPWSAGLFLGNRLDFDDGAYVQIASPRLKRQMLPWLDLGLGLSVLSIENTTTDIRYLQLRPELEVNPKFAPTPDLRLEWRNRLEMRLNEGEDFTTNRTRHRLQLSYTLPQPLGPLTRLFISNEWLIDLHRGQWSENRLVPIGVTLKTSTSTDLDFFYMVLSHHKTSDWQSESVAGTYFHMRF